MQLEYEFAGRTAVPARTSFKNLNTSKPKLVTIILNNTIYSRKKITALHNYRNLLVNVVQRNNCS
jgi:hypothetical protein